MLIGLDRRVYSISRVIEEQLTGTSLDDAEDPRMTRNSFNAGNSR